MQEGNQANPAERYDAEIHFYSNLQTFTVFVAARSWVHVHVNYYFEERRRMTVTQGVRRYMDARSEGGMGLPETKETYIRESNT